MRMTTDLKHISLRLLRLHARVPEWCRWPGPPIRTKSSLRDFESGPRRTILPLRRPSRAAVLARYGASRRIVPLCDESASSSMMFYVLYVGS